MQHPVAHRNKTRFKKNALYSPVVLPQFTTLAVSSTTVPPVTKSSGGMYTGPSGTISHRRGCALTVKHGDDKGELFLQDLVQIVTKAK